MDSQTPPSSDPSPQTGAAQPAQSQPARSQPAETQPAGSQPTETQPNEPQPDSPQVIVNATESEIKRFISTIKNVEQQVGEHIIQALQHADTVAVITSVVVGPDGRQHIVSAALNPSRAAQVNALLQSAVDEREEETLCYGFHCLVKPKEKDT